MRSQVSLYYFNSTSGQIEPVDTVNDLYEEGITDISVRSIINGQILLVEDHSEQSVLFLIFEFMSQLGGFIYMLKGIL